MSFIAKFSCSLAFIAILFHGAVVKAAAIAPAILFEDVSTKDGSGLLTSSESRQLEVDTKALWNAFYENFMIGGITHLESNASNADVNGFAIGPSAGYANGPFQAVASLYLLAERRYVVTGIEAKL